QGYLIEKSDAEQVKGRKAYRSEGDQNTFIEVNVVCVGEEVGSTIFANGVLSTYDLKKSSSPASVGVSAIGSISLPIGRSADSLVKIAEETIDDPAFYKRFFGAVTSALQGMRARAKPPASSSSSPSTSPTEALSRPATPGGLAVETLPAAPAAEPTPTPQVAPAAQSPATPQSASATQPAEAPAAATPEPVTEPGTTDEPEPEPLF
ncbi:MAG: DUF2242 domain-containing protein, partial [Gammaproteobacteria bacterium]